MAIDPVCGRDIHPKTSQWLIDYRGKAFHFCTGACHDKFIEDPAHYATSESPAIVADDRIAQRERVVSARVPAAGARL